MAVLFISCEVRPKWINSLYFCNPRTSNFSLIKYSTALTSWLVTFSVSLICCASAVENVVYRPRKSSKRRVSKSASCGNGSSTKAIKYSISTLTRYFINASSEKKGIRDAVFDAYLPSIGEIACSAWLAI